MNVELDRNLSDKEIFTKKCGSKNIKYLLTTCIGCHKERECITWKWTKRSSDYCKSCFARYVSSQSPKHVKHGLSIHPIYQSYKNMLNRCYNEKCSQYQYYGAKGIRVCDKWLDKEKGLVSFFSWSVQNNWSKGLQIDRIDNKGNYEPTNAQWITQLQNLQKMENLFGIEGRKVKCTELNLKKKSKSKENKKSELKIDPPEDLESFTKLDEYFVGC
tara:strand:- start:7669 stop:8316 length:648 start_codon:yes stop_codon:yes gene_type:complete